MKKEKLIKHLDLLMEGIKDIQEKVKKANEEDLKNLELDKRKFEIPLGVNHEETKFDTKRAFKSFHNIFQKTEKNNGDFLFELAYKANSVVEARILTAKQHICKKVVVGTRKVPETVVPEHEEDIYEWKCPESILKS
jgi:hypothetical protein